jgi:CubicO group peptidase (beta-lactamase class C family)
MVGGLIGVFPYLAGDAHPWRLGALLGAFIGSLTFAVLYRFVRYRSAKPARAAARRATVLLLGVTTAGLVYVAWFLLAVANPRLTRVVVNPAVPSAGDISQSIDPDSLRLRMAELANIYLSRPENAGIVIGVTIEGRRTVVSAGVAAKNRDARPVDENSLFEVGSVTKVFTGIALADAVVAGVVTSNQRVVQVFGNRASPALSDLPTELIDLATHTAGLPEYPSAMPWWTAVTSDNPYARLSERKLVESLGAATSGPTGPRSYKYSNFGFVLLGYLLELAHGYPYSRVLDERVLKPLGMPQTRVTNRDLDGDRLVNGHALGRTMPHWTGHTLVGAAGVVSSVADLLTLIEAHLRPTQTPLQQAVILAMTDHREAYRNRRVGFGWHIIKEDDAPDLIYHSGNTLGFYAYVGFSPQSGVGVVVLGNSNDPTAASIGSRFIQALSTAAVTSTGNDSTGFAS